jgi:hypothetical protein
MIRTIPWFVIKTCANTLFLEQNQKRCRSFKQAGSLRYVSQASSLLFGIGCTFYIKCYNQWTAAQKDMLNAQRLVDRAAPKLNHPD